MADDDELAASGVRYLALVEAGMPLSKIAVAAIGFVNSNEGRACQRALLQSLVVAGEARVEWRTLNLRSHPGWLLCHKFGQSCRDVSGLSVRPAPR